MKRLGLTAAIALIIGCVTNVEMALAQSAYQITVNSALDGDITPDINLTLREAIALSNGTLSIGDLSPAEQELVIPGTQSSQILFHLPAGDTTIELQSLLPPLMSPGLSIDARTQPGYDGTPLVALTSAPEKHVIRGLTIAAHQVSIRGVSLYGFNGIHTATATALPADILVLHQPLPQNHRQKKRTNAGEVKLKGEIGQPPSGIVIEQNWLGIPPSGQAPAQRSAFGVSILNSTGTTIRQNQISYHDGSGIITGDRAQNTVIQNNLITHNGLAGMPDAIRLEGHIANSDVSDNTIVNNDGSAIYLFKPSGSVNISDNHIENNGLRLRRAAIYLMGHDHHVRNNVIQGQSGPGVSVAAYPSSDRNLILGNQFGQLDGLSIDLMTRRHVAVSDYQRGDGVNPPRRDSENRRRDTGNQAMNTPQFLSSEFIQLGQSVGIDGIADPGAEVTIYQVLEAGQPYGPLSRPLATVTADENGRFATILTQLDPGDRISAIATHPDFGTSEPALNATIRSID